MCSDVCIVLSDIYDETSYDKQDIKVSKLTTIVQVVCVQLSKVIVKSFLHSRAIRGRKEEM